MSRRWNAQPVALTLVILIWVSPPLLAEGPWLPLLGGLAGQNIWALEVSPSGYILAGTAEYEPKTMFRSTDFGITWIEVSGLPSNVEIWDIELDPTNESIVYAGLNGAGVWKSLDAGISWDSSNLDGQVWAVDVSPSNPSFVYAASQTGGIYRSADGGSSWNWVSQGFFDNAVAVAVHPDDPDIAFAGTPFQGAFKTTDGGTTWSDINSGFGFAPWILSFWIDPLEPNAMLAGDWSNGVFKSLDGGETWFRPDPTLYATVGEIKAFDGDLFINNIFDDNGIPAYLSADGGSTWEPLSRLPNLPGNLWPRSLAVAPGIVLLGTVPDQNPGGIYYWQLELTVESVLTWIDSAVAEGSLEGSGAGASADGRLNALIKMIELSADLIESGFVDEACSQLLDVLRKTDGQSPPPDFVEGPAAADLAQFVLELKENLGCN